MFVDDTGHERLVEDHPVFGLGGCGVLAADLDRVIRRPWHEVRRRVNSSADTPLHAATFGRTATKDQIEVVAEFFRDQPFGRIGATVTVRSRLVGDLDPIDPIAGVLKNRIVDIARWTPFTELHIVFESSERADREMERAFGDFRLEGGWQAHPGQVLFHAQAAADPALEVADFVMHAVGR